MNRLARVLFALGLLLFLGGTAAAQSGDSQEGSSAITGHVTVDGKPARRVVVTATTESRSKGSLAGEKTFKATTDEDGRFSLTGLAPGEYLVVPSAPVLVVPEDVEYDLRKRTIALSEAQIVEGIDFVLERGGVITGRVTDADARPVIGQVIGLVRLNEDNEKEPLLDRIKPFRTDDRGVYRVYGIAKGRYMVAVGGGSTSSLLALSGRGVGGTTYYPGVTDASKAKLVEVAAGSETTGIDISIPTAGEGYEVTGRVVDADTGKAINGAIISIAAVKPESEFPLGGTNPMSQVDSQGRFTFSNITPGQYQATAHIMTAGDYCDGAQDFEVKSEDIKSLEIKVQRGASISGVVSLEGGSPDLFARLAAAGIGVHVQSPGELWRVSPALMPLFGGAKSQIEADGAFRIRGLKAGNATLWLGRNGESNLKIARVERGGVEQIGGIDVHAGDAVTDVRVVVAEATGTIRGHVVLEGGGIPQDASLDVRARRAENTSEGQDESARVGTNGDFLLEGLLPGAYEVTVFGSIRSSSPGSSQHIEAVTQTVSVTNGAQVGVVFIVDLKKEK